LIQHAHYIVSTRKCQFALSPEKATAHQKAGGNGAYGRLDGDYEPAAVSESGFRRSQKSRISASFGVARINPEDNIDITINLADEALYRAKSGGRNRVETAGLPGG